MNSTLLATVLLLASAAVNQTALDDDSSEPAQPAGVGPPVAAAPVNDERHQALMRWQYFQELRHDALHPASTADAPWISCILPADVFSGARLDLADLRLIDADGQEVPFVVRVLRRELRDEAFKAQRFNETLVEEDVRELSLDLGESPPEHNQVEILTEGDEFRRLARLEGSDDGQQWRKMAERPLVRYANERTDAAKLDNRRLHYPPSRFRYLRVRVEPDPLVDREKPADVRSVTVHYSVESPGEYVTWPIRLEPREATRTRNSPSSTWFVEFSGSQIPVERLRLNVRETDLARDYQLEMSGPTTADSTFLPITSGTLLRRPDKASSALEIEFPEQQVTRLRLSMIDYNNPPLTLDGVEAFAPARQLVFAPSPKRPGPLRLYYGNPKAEPPHYDLERNLPSTLVPPPSRQPLAERQMNPAYQPAPPPLSERLPWMIYVVLSTVSVVVAGVLLDVGRRAVRHHDAG